jgi:hypothetical protein
VDRLEQINTRPAQDTFDPPRFSVQTSKRRRRRDPHKPRYGTGPNLQADLCMSKTAWFSGAVWAANHRSDSSSTGLSACVNTNRPILLPCAIPSSTAARK